MDLSLYGTKLSDQDASILFTKLLSDLQMNTKCHNKFIGCHPITLNLNNIDTILNKDFMVCEKSDGVRVFFYITEFKDVKRAYFNDRKNDFYELPMKCPDIKSTLIDGELIVDKNGISKFAIFDCLLYDGVLVADKFLDKRLGFAYLFNKKIVGMITDEKVKRQKTSDFKEIEFYLKKMYKSYGFWDIYLDIPNMSHENDGLIFTPTYEPYMIGKRAGILKWKPPSINTVDFKIVKTTNSPYIYNLVCSGERSKEVVYGKYFNYEILGDSKELYHEESKIANMIGEFSYVSDEYFWNFDDLTLELGGWKLHRIRNDKETPNHIKVVNNIMESIQENFSIEVLCTFYEEMRKNSKQRELLNQKKN